MAGLKKALGAVVALALLASVGCGKPPDAVGSPGTSQSPDDRVPQGSVSQFYTRNVVYRIDQDIVADMPDMNADIHVYDQNKPFIPGNVNDFMVQVHTCHLGIDEKSMSAIMNKYVFNYPGSPISNVTIKCLDGRISQTATMHKFGIPVTTELDGTIQPNGQGQLVFHPDSIKSAGIPVKGLLDMLGVEVANLINSNPDHGLKIDGDNIIMYPDRMLPPPTMRGQVMGCKITPGKIEMDWDDGVHRDPPPLPRPADNYILMWGGNILIGSNLALGAKFEMIDENPQDPMYYYMPMYLQQLQVGMIVPTVDGANIAYLPDVKGTTVPDGIYTPQLPIDTSQQITPVQPSQPLPPQPQAPPVQQ